MTPTIEKISAITFRVLNMKASVQFYRNVLGMELLYGGEQASFSSLRANYSESAILNLEQGHTVSRWGRLIFHAKNHPTHSTHQRNYATTSRNAKTLAPRWVCSRKSAQSCIIFVRPFKCRAWL
jgi:catechol-2,3-dioxygenase